MHDLVRERTYSRKQHATTISVSEVTYECNYGKANPTTQQPMQEHWEGAMGGGMDGPRITDSISRNQSHLQGSPQENNARYNPKVMQMTCHNQSSPLGGGGSWNPKVRKFVYQKQPNQYYFFKFHFSRHEIRVRGGGGG